MNKGGGLENEKLEVCLSQGQQGITLQQTYRNDRDSHANQLFCGLDHVYKKPDKGAAL